MILILKRKILKLSIERFGSEVFVGIQLYVLIEESGDLIQVS